MDTATPPSVYLDHAATTPMLPVAVEAMRTHLEQVGNASSLHASGRRARRVVEESREQLAQSLGCRPGEVVFTSGGTESDNLALKGIYWARRAQDPRRVRVLATAVEHHAVLDPLHWLAVAEGAKVELLEVDATGRLDVEVFRQLPGAGPRVGRPGLGDVGQQRGRHAAADRRRRGDRGAPTGSRCTPTRVQAVGSVPGARRRQRRGRADLHRAQARRALRRRCAGGAPARCR